MGIVAAAMTLVATLATDAVVPSGGQAGDVREVSRVWAGLRVAGQ